MYYRVMYNTAEGQKVEGETFGSLDEAIAFVSEAVDYECGGVVMEYTGDGRNTRNWHKFSDGWKRV